jgi:hypothetical protein
MDGYFSATPYGDVALHGNDMDTFEQKRRDAALDEALRCTFPASDPVALNFAFTSPVAVRTELIRRAFPRKSS